MDCFTPHLYELLIFRCFHQVLRSRSVGSLDVVEYLDLSNLGLGKYLLWRITTITQQFLFVFVVLVV